VNPIARRSTVWEPHGNDRRGQTRYELATGRLSYRTRHDVHTRGQLTPRRRLPEWDCCWFPFGSSAGFFWTYSPKNVHVRYTTSAPTRICTIGDFWKSKPLQNVVARNTRASPRVLPCAREITKTKSASDTRPRPAVSARGNGFDGVVCSFSAEGPRVPATRRVARVVCMTRERNLIKLVIAQRQCDDNMFSRVLSFIYVLYPLQYLENLTPPRLLRACSRVARPQLEFYGNVAVPRTG